MVVTKRFKVTGMSCAVCAAHVKKAVEGVKGVSACEVNLTSKNMTVTYEEKKASPSSIKKAVEKAGFGMETEEGSDSEDGSRRRKIRLVISICLLLILMYISMGSMLGAPLPDILSRQSNPVNFLLIQMCLSIAVVVVNFPFLYSGIKSAIKLSPTMNTLVAVGVFASLGYGIYTFVCMLGAENISVAADYAKNLYFESAATILTVVSFGKFLEDKNRIKTNSALSSLVSLTPKTAVILKDGEEITVSVEDIKKGDVVILKTGDVVPVDGVVLKGNGSLDVSAMTGESVPVFVEEKSEVISSAVVADGYIELIAEKVGEDTSFSRLIALMEAAGASKVPLARVADKVSAVFVPSILVISLITLIVHLIFNNVSDAINCAVSVLVVSCPCALGLATPAAVAVGCGEAARRGILIKDAGSFENMAKARTVILDKTGTITEGKMYVDSVYVVKGEMNELLRCASSVESLSSHPLSKAIFEYYDGEKYEVESFESVSGKGVSGHCNGKSIILGNERYLTENGLELLSGTEKAKEGAFAGATPIFMGVDGELSCIFFIKDKIKNDAVQSVNALCEMNLDVIMVTGDRKESADSVAKSVGITEVAAEVLPGTKEEYVKKYKENGAVIMVGDGVNDSVALASADTGIAIGMKTPAASCSADVILINDGLDGVVSAVFLAKKVLGNIKINLFWAFFYNVIGIPIAAGVFINLGVVLNPMIAATAMSLSSLFVVLNALRIRVSKK